MIDGRSIICHIQYMTNATNKADFEINNRIDRARKMLEEQYGLKTDWLQVDKASGGIYTILRITGNTYTHKETIKARGFRWNRKVKCWEIHGQNVAIVRELVRRLHAQSTTGMEDVDAYAYACQREEAA